MALTKIENANYLDDDWQGEIESKDEMKKGVNISNWDYSGSNLLIKQDSSFDVSGSIYVADADETAAVLGTADEYTIAGAGSIISIDYDGTTYVALTSTYNPPVIWYTTDPTGTWTSKSITAGIQDAFQVRYLSDGYWYIVGDAGLIVRTTDPTGTWTDLSLAIGNYGCHSIEYDGTTYVIGGSHDPGIGTRYYTSTNGTSWTARLHSSPTTAVGDMNDIKYEGGTWVAACYYGRILYSTTPTTSWTVKIAGGTSNNSITYDETNDYWIMTCNTGIYYASTPSGTWTRIDPTTTLLWSSDYVYNVKYYNGVTWVVGRAGDVAYSTSGTSWTISPDITTSNQFGLYVGSTGLLTGTSAGTVTFTQDGLLSDSYIYYDGTSWTDSLTIPSYDGLKRGYYDGTKRAVGYWNGTTLEPVTIEVGYQL